MPDQKTPLIENPAVPSTSIIPFAGWLASRPQKAQGSPLIVTAAKSELPKAADEGAWLAKKLGGAKLYRGDATRREVLDALEDASLFHFAGHGVFRASSPWKAHLVLGDEETLTLEDLLLAQPKVKVAVLNGCKTGADASGTIIIPHIFLLAGGEAVLAADDDIEDGAAQEFIQTFYEANGATEPGKGIRKAVEDARQRSDEVWRRFHLFGRPVL